MKIEDVPNDLKYFQNTVIRDVTYAVDDNGNYKPIVSGGWDVKADALDLTWDEINEKCEKIRAQILKGKLSPLAYHMEKNIMSVKLLATYSGVPKRTIKKHLKPKHFQNIDNETLQKYADVLRISVEELKKA